MGTPCPYFTGRTEILKRLDLFFAPRSTPVKPRREFLLFGMGGVGKSEIALKVAQNIESR
jgi:ATP-dependent Clp protease ATP-binding subunit ClpA